MLYTLFKSVAYQHFKYSIYRKTEPGCQAVDTQHRFRTGIGRGCVSWRTNGRAAYENRNCSAVWLRSGVRISCRHSAS
jgi:hypothetical protein